MSASVYGRTAVAHLEYHGHDDGVRRMLPCGWRLVTICCDHELHRTLGQKMTEAQLRELLSQETLAWAERSPADIVAELAKPRTYRRGTGGTFREIEVTLL